MTHYNTLDAILLELILPEMINTIYMLIWTTFFSLIPVTRSIVGTSIGKTAAIVPLTTVTMCVVAKFIYDSLLEVNVWVIEAAKSLGASDLWVFRIMIKEALPEIISRTTVSTITTLGSTAMMGALGAGGVGYVAVVHGYQRTNSLVIWTVVVVMVIFTQMIQYLGEFLYRKWR